MTILKFLGFNQTSQDYSKQKEASLTAMQGAAGSLFVVANSLFTAGLLVVSGVITGPVLAIALTGMGIATLPSLINSGKFIGSTFSALANKVGEYLADTPADEVDLDSDMLLIGADEEGEEA